MSVEVTIVVFAERGPAWERWSDLEAWPEWNPHCLAATLDGPLELSGKAQARLWVGVLEALREPVAEGAPST